MNSGMFCGIWHQDTDTKSFPAVVVWLWSAACFILAVFAVHLAHRPRCTEMSGGSNVVADWAELKL